MKKKLEAELISIAHRILKLKNKSDLLQLHLEARNLYEKLSVLKFAEENLGEAKPTIGLAEVVEKLENAYAEANETTTETAELVEDFGEAADEISVPEVTATAEVTQELEENTIVNAPDPDTKESLETAVAAEKIEDEPVFEPEIPAAEDAGVSQAGETAPKEADLLPSFELAFDKKETPKEEAKPTQQISFDDFLSSDYKEPVFVKAGEQEKEQPKPAPVHEPEPEVIRHELELDEDDLEDEIPEIPAETPAPVAETPQPAPVETPKYEPKPTLPSDHLSKTIVIGLNDRIGFEKQLFAGSSEDLNRVLSQLNTFDTFQEAQDFIEDMVKPDYNNWDGKDDYAHRFMEIVEKKFS